MLAVLAVAAVAPPSPADITADRLVVQVDSGGGHWAGEIVFRGTAVASSDDPLLVGYIRNGLGTKSSIETPGVIEVPPDGITVSTPATELVVAPRQGGRVFDISMRDLADLMPGYSRLIAVLFIAGASSVSLEAELGTQEGSAAMTAEPGAGTHVLRVTQGEGAAVDGGHVAAGRSLVELETDTPIVGGFVTGCDACRWSYRTPDGRERISIHTAHAGGTPPTSFAGPLGRWRWSFEGIDRRDQGSRTVYGAYTEIDERWRLFAFRPRTEPNFGGDAVDWAVVTLTAGPTGAEETAVLLDVELVDRGEGDVYFGYGEASPYQSYVSLDLRDDEEVVVEASDTYVPIRPPDQDPMGYIIATGTPELGPFESAHLLVFSGGAWIQSGVVRVPTEVDLTMSIEQGAGSRVIDVLSAEPTAAQVGVVTVGSIARTIEMGRGVVGAFAYCVRCRSTWTSPDGTSGSLEVSCDIGCGAFGTSHFSGPDGSWTFTWEGADTYAGAVAAVAPIGDLWHAFRAAGERPGEFGGQGIDWVTVILNTDQARETGVVVEVVVIPDGDGPLVIGYGMSWIYTLDNGPNRMVFMTADDFDGDGAQIRTSRELGSVRYRISEAEPERHRLGVGFTAPHVPGNEHAITVFVAGGTIDRGWADVWEASASLRQGGGTRSILLADPDHEGPAIQAGPNGIGTIQRTDTSPTGLVGAFTGCAACSTAWLAPDGEGGLPLGGGQQSFAGPSGEWSWWFTGVGQPAVAAYAPIGDEWQLFREF